MKKFILLIAIIGVGLYFMFNTPRTPEDALEEEEYVEYESAAEQVEPAPPKKKELTTEKKEPEVQESPPEEVQASAPPPDETEQNPDEETNAEEEKAQAMVKAIKNFTPEDLAEVQRYYRRMEKRWMSIVKNMVGDDNYADYEIMRKEFQREREESFREFHRSMVEKHGKKHVYSPTEYEKEVGKKIQETYFQRFRNRFGPENYQRYRQTLQRFNSEAKRNQDPTKGLLQVFY